MNTDAQRRVSRPIGGFRQNRPGITRDESVAVLRKDGLDPMSELRCSPNREYPIMNTVVRARIDPKIKDEAVAVLGSIGLTVSDAFRLMMVRIATEKRLPFEPLVPNDQTIEAMKAAQRSALVTVGVVDDLMADLNADD